MEHVLHHLLRPRDAYSTVKLQASQSGQTVNLSWTGSSASGGSGSIVYKLYNVSDGTVVTSTTATSLSIAASTLGYASCQYKTSLSMTVTRRTARRFILNRKPRLSARLQSLLLQSVETNSLFLGRLHLAHTEQEM